MVTLMSISIINQLNKENIDKKAKIITSYITRVFKIYIIIMTPVVFAIGILPQAITMVNNAKNSIFEYESIFFFTFFLIAIIFFIVYYFILKHNKSRNFKEYCSNIINKGTNNMKYIFDNEALAIYSSELDKSLG
jgi:hypothetical protein